MESKNKLILGTIIGAIAFPALVRLVGTKTTNTLLFSAFAGGLIGYTFSYLSTNETKSDDKKSNIKGGGSSAVPSGCIPCMMNCEEQGLDGCDVRCSQACGGSINARWKPKIKVAIGTPPMQGGYGWHP